MEWNSVISTPNLTLAWRRINAGRNIQYKNIFRPAYLTYEAGADVHIKKLHKALSVGAWEPHHATRIYLPKPSGLQRPLTLLRIEDQIVLQAIANIFAKRLREKRKKIEMSSVFSNVLTKNTESVFFVRSWRQTYSKSQEKCLDIYTKGAKWFAEFDLAAYYDTISHDLLLKNVWPQTLNHGAIEKIKHWLATWSADSVDRITSHGIPQGPLASDFLAEAFLLPIDLRLKKLEIKYVRYVDDIKIFGNSENEVRKSVIQLEQECRHRGLIPQSAKFTVRKITSPYGFIKDFPSLVDRDDSDPEGTPINVTDARAMLKTAITGRPQKISDKTLFRYVMFHAPADSEILNRALKMLPLHPEYIDCFSAYFYNFTRRKRIAREALKFLEKEVPYSYVRGELWHIVARLGDKEIFEIGLPLARRDARERSECVMLSWGVMHFLLKCHESNVARIGRRLSAEHPISRSLLMPIFPAREFEKGGEIVSLLKGAEMEQLAGARELQRRRKTLGYVGTRQRDLPDFCCDVLRSLGVTGRLHRRTRRDWLAESFTSIYGFSGPQIWIGLLGTEYEHCLQISIEAKDCFLSGRHSDWLSRQDSANDLIIRSFIELLSLKGCRGSMALITPRGRLINYGTLIALGSNFDRNFSAISSDLRKLHDRRNALPGSHPYEARGGTRNHWLTKSERASLVVAEKCALNRLASEAQNLGV